MDKQFVFLTLLASLLCLSECESSLHRMWHLKVTGGDGSLGKPKLGSVFVGLNTKSGKYFYDWAPRNGRNYSAIGFLRADTNATGWAYLEITNNVSRVNPKAVMPPVNDSVRAYTAGIAEGLLTKDLIYMHYLNTLDGYCKKDRAYCKRLGKFIAENVLWMKKNIRAHRNNAAIWHQIGLVHEQMAGISDGTSGKFLGPRSNLFRYQRIYLMNMHGELGDLEAALNMTEKFRVSQGGCSAFVKVTDRGDLITSHNTWTYYQNMLRVVKLYDLKFASRHDSEHVQYDSDRPHIATTKMSSYPGYIMSKDDFIVTSERLAIMETTIGNYNSTLWKYVHPLKTIPTAIRSAVANRLAKTGRKWPKIFGQYNSGTYNNEWMVVDYKEWERRRRGEVTGDQNILTVSNQMPGYFLTVDKSDRLMRRSYFASYNIPSIPAMFSISNTTGKVDEAGSIYSYSDCPRSRIFARNQSMVHDLDSAVALMRYNNFKRDPLAKCDGCKPPYSGELAIAARSDLNRRSGIYPLPMLAWRSHGAIDFKMTNADLVKDLNFISQAGPTYDQLPPFSWSTSGCTMKDTPHYGQPDLFAFEPVIYE